MKKFAAIVGITLLGIIPGFASQSDSQSAAVSSVAMEAQISVPQGHFWNGNDYIVVHTDWVKICIGGGNQEYSFNAQTDPNDNYVLTFGNGQCITIYSNGRSLYYNGVKYSKKAIR